MISSLGLEWSGSGLKANAKECNKHVLTLVLYISHWGTIFHKVVLYFIALLLRRWLHEKSYPKVCLILGMVAYFER